MDVPASPHFVPVSLDRSFNVRRSDLPEALRTPTRFIDAHGTQTIRGMPFAFGAAGRPNVVLLDRAPIAIELDPADATYVVFAHVAEDVSTDDAGPAPARVDGSVTGGVVAEYTLEYDDGSQRAVPIVRRFAIQQARCQGVALAAPFACVAALEDHVFPSVDEAQALGRFPLDADELAADRARAAILHGLVAHTRTLSAVDRERARPGADGFVWLYALANPEPLKRLRRIVCTPREARSAIYAVTLTDVAAHPLRAGVRRKLRLKLPEGVERNAIGEVDDAGIDLGTVISVRPALDYDAERWSRASEPLVEAVRSAHDVIVEYAAHPQARLHVGGAVHELDGSLEGATAVAAADRPVRMRFLDGESGAGVAVRLHVHGPAGEYLPPRGHHRKVNRALGEDRHGDFANVENEHAYVDGECVVDLPLGTVYVEITRGYEFAPLRTAVAVTAETDELVFSLEQVLRWRERGWVTADTHVHFLSPQTALLEGKAEGVNVVNLLATQWGETFSNVMDFDGTTTVGAEALGGRGEFLVRVGSENRMQTLGHVSLLGYSGPLIQPLCTGGPSESAIGDPLAGTMAEWARRCIEQGGLVVAPHVPYFHLESAADVVLGLIHAIELQTFNPLDPRSAHLDPYGVARWYRYLNLGYHLPLVGGSDKMSAAMLLGGIRTYAQLGERELTYENWMDAIRAGDTFATVGPLVALRVEGVAPGGQVRLPAGGGRVQVEWEVESVRLPIERVEVIAGGLVAEESIVGGELSARGQASVPVSGSTWIALRVRGSYHGRPDDIAAHTSAVLVPVEGSELLAEVDAIAVLEQIQGAIAYVDTIAPRPEARRFVALRATLEAAYDRLHRRMHAAGVHHRHPLHDPGQPHEH